MRAGYYPIFLDQGVDWTKTMTWRSGGVVVPLSAYSARLTIRHPRNVGEYLIELTEEDGITLSDVAPNIVIELTAEQIDALTITDTRYRLDLDPGGDGASFPLLKGPVEVDLW